MGPFGSDVKKECYVSTGIPILNGSNLQGFKLCEDSFGYLTKEKADLLGKSNAHRGDLIVTHRGTLGQIVYIPSNSKYERYVISQSQFRFRLNEKMAIPEYITYYFHTREGQHKLLSNASQVGVPALARATSTFKQLEISLPPLETQRRIVAILSSLDDKIENNNRINRNLEAQAQALFKSWFVDFEPWGGIMPDDWREESLSSIANYLNGLAMQKYPAEDSEKSLPVLKIKELGQKHCDESSDRCSKEIKPEYIIHDGDVIFSWSGTLLVDIWCGGDCGLNQHLFKVTSEKYPKWFYHLWTMHHLENFKRIASDKAVTMGHIKRGDLDKSMVLVPNDETLDRMTALMAPLLDNLVANAQESARLATLRDTLLPKLMKGEIAL